MIGGDAIQVFCRVRPAVTVQDDPEAHKQKVGFACITIMLLIFPCNSNFLHDQAGRNPSHTFYWYISLAC